MPAALKVPEWISLDEFLTWAAPGTGPWQLINSVPVAMAPAGSSHGRIQTTIGGLIDAHLIGRDSPCVAMTNPGVIPAFRANRNFLIPDAAVTCSEADIGVPGIRHPVLIVEILSPSNHVETWRNIRAYMLIPDVREIVVIHTAAMAVDLLRRHDDGSWPDDVTTVTEGTVTLTSIDLSLQVAALYRRSGVPSPRG